jgi:membrane-associated phospholipid phosphatase
MHFSEAMILTVAVSEVIRTPVGRTRPRSSPDNQYDFHFGGGFSHFDERSYPSLHASAAFAAASVLSGELKLRNPNAAKYVAPVLYAAATVPGFTRIYLDQHWASDILSGTFVGVCLVRGSCSTPTPTTRTGSIECSAAPPSFPTATGECSSW